MAHSGTRGAKTPLPDSELLYRSLFESSVAFVCIHKLDGTLLAVNPAAAQSLGYPAEKAVGRSIRDFMPPDSDENFRQYLQQIRERDRDSGEMHVRTREGKIRVWSYSNAVVRPASGEPYVIGHAVDVTERRRAEERFRDLLEAAPDAMVITDTQGKIVLINLQTEKLFGYQRDELLGQPVEILVPERFRERHVGHRGGFAQSPRMRGMGVGLDLFARRRDGSEFPAEISLSPLRTGEETLISSAIRDITERKRAEERFRILLEAAPDAMVISDQRGTIVMANLEAEKLFGYTRQELVGQSVEMLVPERSRGQHVQDRAGFHQKPQRRDRMGEGLDLQARRKDGSEFPAAINLSPLRTAEGTLVLSAIRDITERQRAEHLLRESERYIRVLLENSSDGIAILEADGTLRYVSPASERILGYRTEERTGTSAFAKMHPDDVPRIQSLLAERMKIPGRTSPFEYRVQHADGRWIEVEAIANNLLDDPVIHGIVVNARDVGERKAAEADRERLIAELQEALGKVKTLTGLLPICASCKKIRDDRGHWNHIESFIRDRSDANFSHGICPECARRLYPEHYEK